MSFIKINLLGLAAPKPKAKPAAAPAQKSMLPVWIFLGAFVVSFGIVGLFTSFGTGRSTSSVWNSRNSRSSRRAWWPSGRRLSDTKARGRIRAASQSRAIASNHPPGSHGIHERPGRCGRQNSHRPLFASVTHEGRRGDDPRGKQGLLIRLQPCWLLLKVCGYFDDVQLRQFYEDDKSNLVTYKFNLECSYKPPPSGATTLSQAQCWGGHPSSARNVNRAGAAREPPL